MGQPPWAAGDPWSPLRTRHRAVRTERSGRAACRDVLRTHPVGEIEIVIEKSQVAEDFGIGALRHRQLSAPNRL